MILFLLHIFAHHQAVFSQDQKTFLWRVQSKTSTVYVLGSIHIFKKENYPLHPKIENAFGQSDVLAVEANVGGAGNVDAQKLMEKALYPGDETLEKHLSGETYGFVKKELEGLGIPLQLVQKQRPWFLALTLTSLGTLKLGYDPNSGIDMYFLSKAKGKKRILELESFDYQIRLLSEFSENDQELFLLYTFILVQDNF